MYAKLLDAQRPGRHDLRPGVDDDLVGAAIGSRAHMEGDSVAKRSMLRTVLMKGFHLLVMILCTRNVKDTQCGFKLFTRRSARVLFDVLHLERWSFDTELVYLAEHLDMPLVEVHMRGSDCS
jgi:dolichyl-phosphate beta-glucosyltransferase